MKWKVYLVTLIGIVLVATTIAADANVTTTTETPIIVNTKDSALCKKCKCDIEILLLDCRNKSMTAWFDDEDWNTLINGDIQFETIRLEHNNLTNIPVLKPIQVKNLYINHNLIEKIENAAFHNLLNLTVLNLSNNKITSKILRPEVFQGNYNTVDYQPLPNVTTLDLGYNDLHSLDPDVFEHLPKLETLVLQSNQFHVIDHLSETAIAGLVHLKTLDLSYMELDDLPDNLLHSPRDLETLILTGNLMDEIPDGMELAVNLKKLIFDQNPMGNLEGENVFPNMAKLEYLSISYSDDLVKIGKGAFSELSGLKTLVLSNNPRLEFIDHNAFAKPTTDPLIFDYPPIEELHLYNNNLTTLHYDLLDHGLWSKVKTIDLRQNPWQCDCDNSWLVNTLIVQINDTSTILAKDVECSSPLNWKSIALIDLQHSKLLECNDHKDGHVILGLLICVLIAIPIAVGTVFLYRRGSLNIFKRGNSGRHPLYNRASFQDDFHI